MAYMDPMGLGFGNDYIISNVMGDMLLFRCQSMPKWMAIEKEDNHSCATLENHNLNGYIYTWWLIPLSKWVTTLVINGISGVSPLITGVITHLLSGMNHQVNLCQITRGYFGSSFTF